MLEQVGQLWVTALLVLLVALNDPLYIARVLLGGNHALYVTSVFGQILFSGGLFLFWLVYADGMSSAAASRPFCSFYVPKVCCRHRRRRRCRHRRYCWRCWLAHTLTHSLPILGCKKKDAKS